MLVATAFTVEEVLDEVLELTLLLMLAAAAVVEAEDEPELLTKYSFRMGR